MSHVVRTICMPGEAALDWLRGRARAAVEIWAREWIAAERDQPAWLETLRVDLVCEGVGHHEGVYLSSRTAAGRWWVRDWAEGRLNCNHAVVGSELMPHSVCADEWIREMTERAWRTRNEALCAALLGPPVASAVCAAHELPPDLFAVGSGAVRVSCPALGLDVLADGGVWRERPAPARDTARRAPPITPIERAAHRLKTRLEVELGSVEIEMNTLLDLQRGDVLRLPQRLDQHLPVRCMGQILARAVLGEREGRKSVRVVANESSKQ